MQLSWIQLAGILVLAIMLGAVAVWILMRYTGKYNTRLGRYKQFNIKQDTYNKIYQSLFESIHDGIFIYKDHKLVDCNQHALAIYGRSRAYFENRYPAECSPQFQPNGESSPVLSKKILDEAIQGKYQRFEWVHCRENGEIFDADITIFPFESEQTNLITVVVRDITEKKTLERELFHIKTNLEQLVYNQTQNLSEANRTLNERNKELAFANSQLYEIAASMKAEVEHRKELQLLLEESQEILKSFIEQSSLGIYIVDEELHIASWNPALVTMTGIAESDAKGKAAYEIEARLLGKVDKMAKIKAKMAEFINIGEFATSFTQEGEYIRADKNKGFVRSTTFPIYTGNKKYFGRISQDITYEKMLEAKQLDYSRQVDELLIKQAETNIDLFQKLTTIFNNTNTNIAFFTIENGDISLATCNTTWAEALDKNSNDIQGKRLSEFYDNKAEVFITKLINTALNSRKKINEEVFWEHNGNYYYLDFTTIPIESETNSEVKQVACFYRDITEKRIMEKTLQEREAHLARAQELAHIGSWKWDLATNEMLLSKEMERIYEFDTSKPTKLPDAIFEAIHPDDYDRIFEHVTYNKEHVNSTSIEHRIKFNDGRVKYILVVNNTIGDSNGIPTIIEGTTQDITQQKEYEQSIIESEAKFREIFDNSLDTISLICLLYTSPSPRDRTRSRMPSSA
jgi:PAS domain S-box-containing protein